MLRKEKEKEETYRGFTRMTADRKDRIYLDLDLI